MEIPRLRSFVYAAQLGSISKAATQLRVAQPVISRHVHKLERELGVPLLIRQGHGVRPTEAGETLLARGEAILRQLRQTKDEVVARASVASGEVTLAMPPAAGRTIAAELVARYRERCPNVTLHVLSGLSGFIRDWLSSGRVDVALVHDPQQARGMQARPLLVEDLEVIAPSAARMSKLPKPLRGLRLPRQFTVERIAELPLILPARPHGLRVIVEEAAARRGIELDVLEVDNLEIIKTLVERGLGFSVMAGNATEPEVRQRKLRKVAFAPPGISWTLGLVVADRRPSRAAVELVEVLEGLVQELVANGVWRGRPLASAEAQPG